MAKGSRQLRRRGMLCPIKGKETNSGRKRHMDKAEQLWAQNDSLPPKQRLSMRAIAATLELLKNTVIERLSGRRKGHGHIAGGKRKGRVLHRRWATWSFKTITITILPELASRSASGSLIQDLVPLTRLNFPSLYCLYCHNFWWTKKMSWKI